jgi:hypothetical protein
VFEPLAFECEATAQTPKITTRNVLERQIGLTFDLTMAQYVHDVWMGDVTGKSCLFGEHLLCVGLVRDVREHSLQYDDAWFTDRPRFEGAKHFRHSANCNTVNQCVVAERCIRRWRRRW